MTKKEAIKWLRSIISAYLSVEDDGYEELHKEAIETAIEAMRTQDVPDTNVGDNISRQAAIDIASGYCHPANIAKELAKLPPAPERKWIPVKEELPENKVKVLVCFRVWWEYSKRYVYTIVKGWHARQYSVSEYDFDEWEGDSEYCEDDDEYYVKDGWYESATQGNGDYMSWYINAEVVAWMPLPEPYKDCPACGAKMEGDG